MKIHLVSEHASPLALLGGVDAGGQNVHVASLAVALAELGADVVVHTRRDDPAQPQRVQFAPNVVVDHVDAGPPEPLPKDDLLPHMREFADGLEARWRDDRPHAVHAHFWMSGLAATLAGQRLSIPVAQTFHALGAEKSKHQGIADTSPGSRLAIERWLAQTVDCVIATTLAERSEVIAMGARAERVHVIPCGVDLGRFECDGPGWPPPTGRARVVCISRLVPRKGIADVIEAVAALDDVELLIAGGPPAGMIEEDEYGCELLELARVFNAEDRVTFLGSVTHEVVPELIRSADIVCCTPWYEPFGIVAVEAMACGVPVVASAVGGLAETVVDGVTGLLVPPRRPDKIRSAIHRLMRQPGLALQMRQASVERAPRYGWNQVAVETAAALGEMVRTAAPHPVPSREVPR